MTDDPLRYFRIEARDIAEQMGRDVSRLEAGPAPDLVPRLLRLAHTLKGAARVVKQNEIAEQAHAIEDTLAPLRDGASVLSRGAIDDLLRQVDEVASLVASLNQTGPDAPAPSPQPVLPEPSLSTRADPAELDLLYEAIDEAGQQLRGLRGAIAAIAGVHSPLVARFDQTEREIGAARDTAAKLRLAPAAGVFDALARTARDVARSQGKTAVFNAQGGDIRIDASVLGVVRGALIQLVRNAVAHGIEAPAERARRGKPAAGQVTLAVERRNERIAFVCDDDGGGIDLPGVRRVAAERGASPEALARLDAAGLVDLLLHGGLSTAPGTNQVAGRGIGLDVVRDAARQLGGEIEVATDSGWGTRIALVVPVSLATLEALLVEAGGAVAAIPLNAVRHTFRVTEGSMARTAGRDTVLHDGIALALTPLADLLHGPQAAARTAPRCGVIIAGIDASAAIGVDRLLGVATVIVQPLPPTVRADAPVAGAALDADGVPRLVLDPAGLALLVSSRNGAEDRCRAVEAGASGYIVKGEFDQNHFLDTVRRLAG